MWNVLRITGGAALAVWVVSGPVSAQHWHDEREHWVKYDKHLDDDRDREADVHLQGCFLQPADVHIVSAYYAPRYRELPAAQRKKFFRSSHLPPGWEKKIEPLPASVEHQLIESLIAEFSVGHRRQVKRLALQTRWRYQRSSCASILRGPRLSPGVAGASPEFRRRR